MNTDSISIISVHDISLNKDPIGLGIQDDICIDVRDSQPSSENSSNQNHNDQFHIQKVLDQNEHHEFEHDFRVHRFEL